MKIKCGKKILKDFRLVNFYQEDKEKKLDTKSEKFLNFKIEKELNLRQWRLAVRGVVMRAKQHKQEKIAFDYQQIKKITNKISDLKNEKDLAKNFLENIIIAEYKFDKYLSDKSGRIKECLIIDNFTKTEKENLAEAEIVAESVNWARDLANTPGSEMTPDALLKEVRKKFTKLTGIKISVVDEKQAKKLGMNLFLAVSRGSAEEGKMIIVEYKGNPKNKNKKVLLGKGITYDTGGLSLKPMPAMLGMEKDMTGSATVLASLLALAKLKVKQNVVAVAVAVENAISAKSYKPGDLLKSMSGISVEVKNTDAEGRLVLADALTYIQTKIKPQEIIDVATLTGAALVAVGERASVLMSRNNDLSQKILTLGEKSGDYVWPLPLWDEYEQDIKSELADIANIGKNSYGGSITAGIFLYQFVKENIKNKKLKWAHLDIAPRMDSILGDNLEVGATGEPVRLLIEYARE